MGTIELEFNTITVGELRCGCWFDQPGTHAAGNWFTCSAHNVPTRLMTSLVTVTAGGLIAS